MMALAIAMLLLALVAAIAVRIVASPLFRCVRLCFGSWAEAARGEQFGRS